MSRARFFFSGKIARGPGLGVERGGVVAIDRGQSCDPRIRPKRVRRRPAGVRTCGDFPGLLVCNDRIFGRGIFLIDSVELEIEGDEEEPEV